jgi:hypothetical protein
MGGGGVDREVFYQGGHDDEPAVNTVELLDLGDPIPHGDTSLRCITPA